jgi:hypothetical protein
MNRHIKRPWSSKIKLKLIKGALMRSESRIKIKRVNLKPMRKLSAIMGH